MLPLLVLWRQDNTLFTGYGYLDPWFYLGFFRNLVEFKRNLFPGTYYGSRLSVILPGAAVHSLFPAVAANCILHLGLHTAATVSLFLILKWVTGVRRAFLAAMLFSVNPWLWSATGWDNPDGFAIAYCLLTMALLTWAALSPDRRWALVAAGMTMAALVYANLFWVTLAPLLPLSYIGLTWTWRRTPIRRSFLLLCGWFGAGCVTATVALGGVNYFLDGHFFFYAPSVLEALQLHGTGAKSDPPWSGCAPAPWLWLATVAAIASVVVLASRWRKWTDKRTGASVLFAGQFLCALAWMVYTQAHGNEVLGIFYYAGFLMPFTFLVIGTWFWPGVDQVATRTYVRICCAGAAVFGLVWVEPVTLFLTALPYAALAGAVILTASLAVRRRPAGILLSLVGFALLVAPAVGMRYGGLDPREFQRQYESILLARSRIEAVRQGHAVRFWYDQKDRAAPDAAALSSTYLWSASLLGIGFAGPCDVELPPSTIVAVISADEAGRGPALMFRAMARCWEGKELRFSPVETDTIDRGRYRYDISILRVEAVPGAWLPLDPVFAPSGPVALREMPDSGQPVEFPPRYWTVEPGDDSHALLRPGPDGLLVKTHSRPDSLAALYPPMSAPAAGLYRFRMRMWPGAGSLRFGAYDRSRNEPWLAYSAKLYWNGTDSDIVFWVRLAEGQEFQLALANSNGAVHLPASLLMKSVTAVRVAR
jgi:hypothetical protein